ncbi:hypothetical protein LC593_14845 [Nostoc sp. CHAB 5844]|nr:hypothetical protein [Nostoc sp. CHAB 5844]
MLRLYNLWLLTDCLEVRSHGVERTILFTNRENHAAQAAYQGIGFQPTGEEFGLVIFQDNS